jgi:hypothetical protein
MPALAIWPADCAKVGSSPRGGREAHWGPAPIADLPSHCLRRRSGVLSSGSGRERYRREKIWRFAVEAHGLFPHPLMHIASIVTFGFPKSA